VIIAGEMIESNGQATQGIVTSLRYRYCVTFLRDSIGRFFVTQTVTPLLTRRYSTPLSSVI
jgi:hypothetical protein